MAQTKRKRRTKHRGNAAGVVEARGRTGRKPTAEEQKKADDAGAPPGAREQAADLEQRRADAPADASLLLFVLTADRDLRPKVADRQPPSGCALFAMLIYIPLGYATDRWVYNRRMRNQQKAKR